MITTHPRRRRTAITLLAAGALALAGCSTDNDPAQEAASPPASLETYGIAGLDAPEIIDTLDTMPVADRPADLIASVQPTELSLNNGGEELATLPMPDDEFYLSVAPYENRTHSCHFHSLTTCLGEMAGEQVHVTVTDTTTGQTLVDEPRTTYDNGFLGLWLPRDITATLTIGHDGKTATSPIATGDQDLTCLTTMQIA
ncbi:CueP family metal-binding protein [Dietzia cinnamea]|uniref:CueP family metal-binding protein n=1 Tax=Dietzia cinnamea TaxID=321318 RepID=A0AAW5Q963_9ACTN|nr:CueP family metal-binding protein [Dietzia cinnamea]MCT2033578.1 CueP family metal-binding protein [Dietzia cinnamea]MCT2108765.1 CueP family metal-binding protein [Dietzia cinnamea]MCT2117716.1 CueP family metal-binding protein [Dietzia cinnamea]